MHQAAISIQFVNLEKKTLLRICAFSSIVRIVHPLFVKDNSCPPSEQQPSSINCLSLPSHSRSHPHSLVFLLVNHGILFSLSFDTIVTCQVYSGPILLVLLYFKTKTNKRGTRLCGGERADRPSTHRNATQRKRRCHMPDQGSTVVYFLLFIFCCLSQFN